MHLHTQNLFLLLGTTLVASVLLQLYNWRRKYLSPPPTPTGDEDLETEELTKTSNIQLLVQFARFQFIFLVVFVLVKMSDWLQGPYVYALYREYGLSQTSIGILFVGGFGAAGVFGSFIGTIADMWGRRLVCLVFCASYAAACVTKHFNNFPILMVGRILAGLATAILFSVFDTWMVHEHHARQFKEGWIAETFTRATFLDGVVAIVAALIASVATHNFGMVAPFDVAFFCLIAGACVIWWTWNENFGEPKRGEGGESLTIRDIASQIVQSCRDDKRIIWAGVTQSFFEGAMFSFVFMWTPCLPDDINHGTVFAIFMAAITIGSALFTRLQSHYSLPVILTGVCIAASFCLSIPIFVTDPTIRLLSFIFFEVCCGCYFPSFYTLRAKLVPDAVRASILNLYRLPLNVIVICVCVYGEKAGVPLVFAACTGLQQVAAIASWMIYRITEAKEAEVKCETEVTELRGG